MYQILNWCGKMRAGGRVLEGQVRVGLGNIGDRLGRSGLSLSRREASECFKLTSVYDDHI